MWSKLGLMRGELGEWCQRLSGIKKNWQFVIFAQKCFNTNKGKGVNNVFKEFFSSSFLWKYHVR